MKKFLLIFLVVFMNLIFINTVYAENFHIENYNVNLIVNENKKVNVEENITVKFTSPSHGIYRTIPYKNAYIDNISVNTNSSKNFNNNTLTIKIGDPDKFVDGIKNYKITYDYNIIDNINNEFYFNIIGTDWPVKIKNAGFTVTMPKDFDIEKTGISIGEYGTKGFKDTAEFQKISNKLLGKITKPLNPYNGITLRVEVPDDYFTNNKDTQKKERTTILAIIILTLISAGIWYKFGKDEHITPIVTFYPPNDVNSIEAELVYKEKASTKGLVALIIELAGKGYLSINEDSFDKNFIITKNKEYEGKNQIEKNLLSILFENSNTSINLDSMMTSETFYLKCQKLIDLCNNQRKNVFETSSLNILNKIIIFGCIFGLFYYTLMSMCNYIPLYNIKNIMFLLTFVIISIIVALNNNTNRLMIIWAIGFGGIPLLMLREELSINLTFCPASLLGICGIVVSFICLKQLAKKNKLGQLIMSQLLGLKHFLDVAEKHRLKKLAADNPSYFFDILPFAYILDVSDKWIEKFQNIMDKNPDWYVGNNFNKNKFKTLTESLNKTTIPTRENGGIKTSSSGGGGFCGGGHGGGGGGSW